MVGHADACWILPPGRPRCRAYVCIPVEDSLASRSPVIETLMEIEGIAELPDGVPVADFLSWSSMATDELSAFHADDVCQALRVCSRRSQQLRAVGVTASVATGHHTSCIYRWLTRCVTTARKCMPPSLPLG